MSFDEDFDRAVERVLKRCPDLSDDKLDVRTHFPYVRAVLLPVATNYHGIGAFLGLLPSKLRKFKGRSDSCLTEVLAEWFLNHGPVTWRRVVIVIADPSAGDNPGYAGQVAEEYKSGIKPIPEANGVDDKEIGSSAYGAIRKVLIDGGLGNKWMEIGLYLGVSYKDLQGLDGDNQEKMDTVIETWLSGKGDTEVFGVPSWMKLVEAIGSPAGGSNRQHASEVAKNHQGSGKPEPTPPPGGKEPPHGVCKSPTGPTGPAEHSPQKPSGKTSEAPVEHPDYSPQTPSGKTSEAPVEHPDYSPQKPSGKTSEAPVDHPDCAKVEPSSSPLPKKIPSLSSSPPLPRRKGSACAPSAAQFVHYRREPVESDAKFPKDEIRKIVQHIGLHTNSKYLLLNCIDMGAKKKTRYLSLKPGGRLIKPQIKPRDEGTPWEFTSTSDGEHFTLSSNDESGNTWYFALSPKCAPDSDPHHAAVFGFEAAPNGAKDEFQIYHHHPTRQLYLTMSSNGKDITLSESNKASRWQVVPHDPQSGTHGIECHLYINSYERNDPIFCQDSEGSLTKITKEVQYTTGFDKSIETTDLCGWEKAKESTHSASIGASIGAVFNLFSIAFNADYSYSKTTSKSQFQEKQTVKGLLKQESKQETTTYEIAPGEEIYQKVLVVELYRAWSVKETKESKEPFFIEKSSSIDNRTATIVIRKV